MRHHTNTFTMIAGLLFILCNSFTTAIYSQNLQLVQHDTGTVLLGHTHVTVSHTGLTHHFTPDCTGIGYHSIGSGSGYDDSVFNYAYAPATDHVQFAFRSANGGEELIFWVNGNFYHLTNADLHFSTNCFCLNNTSIQNGKLEFGTSVDGSCVYVDIYYPGIDSVRIHHNSAHAGAAFSAYFSADTIVYIPQPYTDTSLCPGQSFPLVYKTNFRFNNGNTFTAQLSDDTGSFSSPVNIGSRNDTTGDTIWCTIPTNTSTGSGYRLRVVGSTPGDTSVNNQEDIHIHTAYIWNFSNSSNSPVCTGDSIQLMGSTTTSGVSWAWTGPGGFTSSARDTFIANSVLADSGSYILKATLNGCSLNDTAHVEVRPTPKKPVAGSNSPVCETKQLTLNATDSTSGVSYSWTGPGSYSNNTQNPVVTPNTALADSGKYICVVSLNGCHNWDTTIVVVHPKPGKPTASAKHTSLCRHQDIELQASAVTGAGYRWYGPNGYMDSIQNPTRTYAAYNDSGYYHVYATLSGCISDTDSVRITINTDPYVNIFPTPGKKICKGQQVTFSAIPTNGGTVSYDWRVNGVATGSTGVTYQTSSLNNGDRVYCLMTSTGTCSTPFTDTSNQLAMSVTALETPSVTITASPTGSLFPNQPITFTAIPNNAGNNPGFQWKRNGKDVGGATGVTWGANANFLDNGDSICVLIRSDAPCPSPDTALSNCIALEIRLGVDDVQQGKVRVYPNPVRETPLYLSPEGSRPEGSIIQVYDVVGRQLPCTVTTLQNGTISIDMQGLPAGNYLLLLTHQDGTRMRYKVVKE